MHVLNIQPTPQSQRRVLHKERRWQQGEEETEMEGVAMVGAAARAMVDGVVVEGVRGAVGAVKEGVTDVRVMQQVLGS